MLRQAFVSNRVVTPDGIHPGAVLVEDGKIRAVTIEKTTSDAYQRLDFGDDCLLPGLVDTHVHLNDPGREDWEGFWTGTQAAAAGGVTTVVDMPLNCLPGTTSTESLELKRAAAAGSAWVDWMSWGGLVSDNLTNLQELVDAGVPGFKCFLVPPGVEGFSMVREEELRSAAPVIAAAGLPLLVHAELPEPIDQAVTQLNDGDWSSYSTYLSSRPEEAELSAISMLIEICREFHVRIHIVHLSAASALECLAHARAEGLPITVESCPHYLFFAAEEIPDGNTLFKCAPPIRGAANRSALWRALKAGEIDMVASDHSPCPPEMKLLTTGDLLSAWGGIASLSLGLSVMWTKAADAGCSLSDVTRWMAERPAKLAGLAGRKGNLSPGCDADLVVFDPELRWEVTPDNLFFKHKHSPYVGKQLQGKVKSTFVRGKCVFSTEGFAPSPFGAEIRNE